MKNSNDLLFKLSFNSLSLSLILSLSHTHKLSCRSLWRLASITSYGTVIYMFLNRSIMTRQADPSGFWAKSKLDTMKIIIIVSRNRCLSKMLWRKSLIRMFLYIWAVQLSCSFLTSCTLFGKLVYLEKDNIFCRL